MPCILDRVSCIGAFASELMTFQDVIFALQAFWAKQGCIIQQPYDIEVGAGTMHPETFLRVLGPDPYKVAYVQPSRRPADGRYGENPNRLYKHHQYQVILKPSPNDVQDLYLDSLRSFGIDPSKHDIRFEEDNWESPTLGAWGIGWQVLLDGLEITQFTYFQQAGGVDLFPISAEITYGLERITAMLTSKESIYDIEWAKGCTYGQVRLLEEQQFSKYSFELADSEMHFKLLSQLEEEAKRMIEAGLFLVAYEYCLKCSHVFNVLEARGAISVTERTGIIARIRNLVCQVAQQYTGGPANA
jgi:glycyl-tRNA synthetase alpha chain